MSILSNGGEDMSFKVSWKVHLLALLLSCGICFLMKEFISNVFISLFVKNIILNITSNTLVDLLLFLLIAFVPITIIHELFHGCTYQLFDGKVKYGFKGIYAYAQETSGIILHRTRFLIVLLAPLTFISLISLLIPGEIGAVIFLLNLLGSTGDLLMSIHLLRTNYKCYIIDRKYGFDVIERLDKINYSFKRL